MATDLPTDIDATYPDDGDASRKTHQQHHDSIHGYTNTHDTATDPHGDRAYADGKFTAYGKLAGSNSWTGTQDFSGATFTPPFLGARVSNSTDTSVPNSTWTALPFNTEAFDTGALHDTVTNPERFTAPRTGYYLLNGIAQFAANSGGLRELALFKNGSLEVYLQSVTASSATDQPVIGSATIVHLAAGDYVTLNAYQSTGAALNVLAAGTTFAIDYRGA